MRPEALKVLIVANACPWATWDQKAASIAAWFAPLVTLQIDVKQTDFQSVPLAEYPGTVTTFGSGGAVDVPGTDLEIEHDWFNQNIGPLAAGYDIVVFQAANVAATGLPLGIKFENLAGTWCCETFVQDENYSYILPAIAPAPAGINLGNEAEVIIEHEICHALYSISGQTDNTHKFFYANQFEHVLTDIVLPSMSSNPLIALYQKLIVALRAELAILQTQHSTADMHTTPPTEVPAFPPMITKWMAAIAIGEGANPTLHNLGNLKYSTLTASWGATQGPAGSDGGHLCQFASDIAGQDALCNFLKLGCENELIAFHAPEARTLEGFTKIYAGNPPQGYIDGIVEKLGVPADTQISTFLS